MPEWVNHAIWWQLYPLGFVGAEPIVGPRVEISHRLAHIANWLDYAVELGASGLLLGPIFASSTHGYDTIDHFRIDPRLGDDTDFDALIAAARRRGLRVVLDGVFNHVGRDFPAFQEVLAQGPTSPHAGWFRLSWPSGHFPGTEPDYATFEGHRQLVTLNHSEPAVRNYTVRVMNHWLDRGASGWRLDAAYAVPSSFWAEVLPRVRQDHPEAYLFGEVIHGDYGEFVRTSGVDAVTQYELWKAIWSALNDRNLFELAWALERHNRFLDDFVPQTFVGNHDVTRLASRLADDRHIAHAVAILLTCGGTPSIYAGDEQAFRGVKEERSGGDDAIRPRFPGGRDELAAAGWSVYRLHQNLIGLRRRNPWLHNARTKVVHLSGSQMM
jgi:cyclomaltodextrinase / maltogenic alpha-amylase / neopullulanase